MALPHNLSSQDNWKIFKREDDGVVHMMSVLHMSSEDVGLVLECKDLHKPANEKEGRAVAHAYINAQKRLPDGLYEAIDGKIPVPNRRRFFSAQPIHERRDPIINYAAARDAERGLTNKPGSLSHYQDRADGRALAKYMGIPLSGIVDPPPDPYEAQTRIEELEDDLDEANRQRRHYRNKAIQLKKDLDNANDLIEAKEDIIDGKNDQMKILKDRIALLKSALPHHRGHHAAAAAPAPINNAVDDDASESSRVDHAANHDACESPRADHAAAANNNADESPRVDHAATANESSRVARANDDASESSRARTAPHASRSTPRHRAPLRPRKVARKTAGPHGTPTSAVQHLFRDDGDGDINIDDDTQP